MNKNCFDLELHTPKELKFKLRNLLMLNQIIDILDLHTPKELKFNLRIFKNNKGKR